MKNEQTKGQEILAPVIQNLIQASSIAHVQNKLIETTVLTALKMSGESPDNWEFNYQTLELTKRSQPEEGEPSLAVAE